MSSEVKIKDTTYLKRCSYVNFIRCWEVSKMVEDSDDEIMKGSFVFCNHGTSKMAKFRIILRKWLGINDIDIHLVVMRHHFAREVLQYCTQEKKILQLPSQKRNFNN